MEIIKLPKFDMMIGKRRVADATGRRTQLICEFVGNRYVAANVWAYDKI